MLKLIQYSFCPFSRSIRLALVECGLLVELEEERPWAWRRDFLVLNPAGSLPVLIKQGDFALSGTYAISEFLAETYGKIDGEGPATNIIFPGDIQQRAEVRRLTDWFHNKFDQEVSRYLLNERLYQRFADSGRNSPDIDLIRVGRANLRYHLSYIDHLKESRKWLAGDVISFADLSAGGHISVLDYLSEIPWEDYPAAKQWYIQLKSRSSFRPLLADRLPGVAPPKIYTEIEF
jgi:glutathione S-transferase